MVKDPRLIVSVSGVRGIVGEGLTASVALRFASILGAQTQGGMVLLGRDGRPSGGMLQHAIIAGLSANGCAVHDLGVVPTPTVGLAVRQLGAAGAIQITASHNPLPYNGMKLFGPDGRVLTASVGQQIKQRFESAEQPHVLWDRLGSVQAYDQAASNHVGRVLELVDVQGIRQRGLRALLDANGGAGGPTGEQLLEQLGVRVVGLGCGAEGVFHHEPEPIPQNLREVSPQVAREGCDIGFVLDPDADRLALIDETGRYIGEELTLALATLFRLGQQPGPVVVNLSTSRLVEDIAGKFGCVCHRSAVGEANVADRMLEVDAVIGGEGNGGVMDPRVGLVRDPFVGMAYVLNLMAQTGKKLSQLVAELATYHIVKEKHSLDPDQLPALFQAITQRWPEAGVDQQDGLRLSWADRWIHVRPSNTEPVVRVIAEAPEVEVAQGLCREVAGLI